MSHQVDAAAAWIYRGVWASVVQLFRVPDDPPTLPVAGEPVRSLRPAAGFLRYLKFLFWVALIPGDVLPVLAWAAVGFAVPILGIILGPLFLALMILPDVFAYVGIHLRYDTTWYVLTDRSLRIRRGILTIQETTISFENVQNVEVRQGPVQRYFGIADVIVQTAGGGGSPHGKGEASASQSLHTGVLQGLDDADGVRNQILLRVERTRAAGLGDEHPQHPETASGAARAGALSPAHLAVLREIRDSAHRLAAPTPEASATEVPVFVGMFDAFDENARRALFFARWNVTQPGVEFDFHGTANAGRSGAGAVTHGAAELDDVHVLLGVLQGDAEAVTRFSDPAWSRARLRERLSDLAPRDSLVSMAQEIPFSAAAKETVLAAGTRPRGEGRLVVPEHLVWAVLAKPSTPVAALLAEAGVTRGAIEAFLDRP